MKDKNITGIADTGATRTVVTQDTTLNNIKKGPTLRIIMPDNSETTSTVQGNLKLNLPKQATTAHIAPTFKKNLIAIPQVVDA